MRRALPDEWEDDEGEEEIKELDLPQLLTPTSANPVSQEERDAAIELSADMLARGQTLREAHLRDLVSRALFAWHLAGRPIEVGVTRVVEAGVGREGGGMLSISRAARLAGLHYRFLQFLSGAMGSSSILVSGRGHHRNIEVVPDFQVYVWLASWGSWCLSLRGWPRSSM